MLEVSLRNVREGDREQESGQKDFNRDMKGLTLPDNWIYGVLSIFMLSRDWHLSEIVSIRGDAVTLVRFQNWQLNLDPSDFYVNRPHV